MKKRKTKKNIKRFKQEALNNIIFTLNNGDIRLERTKKFEKQIRERGFDDSELWNLDITIAKFILPRLKAFKDKVNGYPDSLGTFEEWQKVLDKMILAFQLIVDDNFNPDFDPLKKTGLDLFCKYYNALWD